MSSSHFKNSTIAIVGGGMVGAVTALLFAKHLPRVKITLFDRSIVEQLDADNTQHADNKASDNHSKAPNTLSPSSHLSSFDGRSTALAPTSQACFEHLGLWDQLQTFITPIHRIHISDKGHAGQGLFDQSDNHGDPLGYVVQNAGLGPVLYGALAQSPSIDLCAEQVDAVRVGAKGAVVKRENKTDYFDLAIIADGAQSALRDKLGIKAQVDDYQQHALVVNVKHAQAHQLTAYERFTDRGPIALLPLGGNASRCESTLVWTCPNHELADYQSMSEPQRLKALQKQFGYRLGAFTQMGEPAFYPLKRIVAGEQVRSHIVLMGNAAHFLHPVAGQGFNLSVRDALKLVGVLKEALVEGQSLGSLEVLEKYDALQALDQRNTIGLSHGFNRIFTDAPLPIQLGRTLGLVALEVHSGFRNHFIALLSGRAVAQAAL